MTRTPTEPRRIVIIGGGFSGVVAARSLIQAIKGDLSLRILEPRAKLGGGVAYSTQEPGHFLNGPASVFSIDPEDPSDFVKWFEAHVRADRIEAQIWRDGEIAFVPRALYGRYLADRLELAVREAAGRVDFKHIEAEASDLSFEAGTARVTVKDHPPLEADHVLLATGARPAQPPFEDERVSQSDRYVNDPWNSASYAALANARRVIAIGSGLTMLDALVSLDRHGFKGDVLVISRRGLSAWPARVAAAWPDVIDSNQIPSTARDLLRAAQRARREIAAAGADWQTLAAALRNYVPLLWDAASERERRLYLRHLRAFWEITRHRAAPPTAELADAWRAQGRLTTRAGEIRRLAASADGTLALDVRFRGAAEAERLTPDGVINCTGTEYDVRRAAATQPLLQNLLARGVIRPGPVSFGIDARKDGAVIGRSGEVNDRLTAIGPLLRGVHWESNAIPEILAQAPAIIERIASSTEDRARAVA